MLFKENMQNGQKIQLNNTTMTQSDLNYYDFFLHYNPHTKLWSAMYSDDIPNYLNGTEFTKPHFCSKDIDTIYQLIEEIQ